MPDQYAWPSRADVALDRAALVWPGSPAIVSPAGRLTFGELSRRVNQCATALLRAAGTGEVVAVSSVLHPDFAVAYYGAIRAGMVVAPLNPFTRPEALARNLTVCNARVALVDTTMAGTLLRLAESMPALPELVLIGPGSAGQHGIRPLEDLLHEQGGPPAPGREPGASEVACILFTSGTTGQPKAVPLTHRNLAANAVQVAHAHGLRHDSRVVNHLPTFHPMHMSASIEAGAVQVLCTDPDPLAAVGVANEHQATHYYSLPVRLGQLARDPRLPDARLDTVRVILSGGSALPPGTGAVLGRHFGIPVVQGYGLAEASPLTHSDGLTAPRPGSVGRPVIGTECRIVDIESRAVVGCGQLGEVEVRGPQVMSGYLESVQPDSAPSPIGPGGWLSTADVGRVDADGYLFIVDRLKDTFKCDNWLVSPSQVEQGLAVQEAVRDCAVVDLPDELHGSVAAAVIVAKDATDLAGTAAAVADANLRAPDYERIRHAVLTDSIPRSPTGKVERRTLRNLFAGDGARLPLATA
jgi:long-chain acyl-CoA synthetase